jgi:hypothetical protein
MMKSAAPWVKCVAAALALLPTAPQIIVPLAAAD